MPETATHFCLNVFTAFPVTRYLRGGEVGVFMIIFGIVYISTSIVILFWIKRQERLAQYGDHLAVKSVIFPVFVNVLWANAFTNLYVGIIMMMVQAPTEGLSLGAAWAYSIMWGIQHMIIEGVAMLLMQKGLGYNAAMNAGKYAFFWGIFTVFVEMETLLELSTGKKLLKAIWELCMLVFYLALWVAPEKYLYRRPAVVVYAAIWFFYRLLSLATLLLSDYNSTAAVGSCSNVFLRFFLFALFQPYVVYRTLLRDSRWWQGQAITTGVSQYIKRFYEVKDAKGPKETGKKPPAEPTSSTAITSPLHGLNVNLHSAQSLADTLDLINTEKGVKLLNFAYIKLETNQMLGQGSFSKVFRGTYKQQECAIKLIFTVDLTVDVIQRVAAESQILSSIKDPNVVNIFGVAVLPPSVCILLELCYYGSLSDVIRGSTGNSIYRTGRGALPGVTAQLQFADIVYLALGCARGLRAIHAIGSDVIHRDVKSHNFLVDSQFNAKVADLELGIIQRGLLKDRSTANHSVGSLPMHIDSSTSLWQAAKECLGFHTTDPNASRKPLMNIRPADDFLANWLPPELIVDPLCTYQASDVFSFGMVLWELVAKKIPFEDIKSQQMIRSKIVMGERPDMSALEGWCDDRYMQLIQSMWLEDPLARPTMSNVCEQLEDMWKASCFDYIVCTKTEIDIQHIYDLPRQKVSYEWHDDAASTATYRTRTSGGSSPAHRKSFLSTPLPKEITADLNKLKLDPSFMRLDAHQKLEVKSVHESYLSPVPPVVPSFPSSSATAPIWAVFNNAYPYWLLRSSPCFISEFERLPIDIINHKEGFIHLLKQSVPLGVSDMEAAGETALGLLSPANRDAMERLFAQLQHNRGFGHALLELSRVDGSCGVYSVHAFPIPVHGSEDGMGRITEGSRESGTSIGSAPLFGRSTTPILRSSSASAMERLSAPLRDTNEEPKHSVSDKPAGTSATSGNWLLGKLVSPGIGSHTSRRFFGGAQSGQPDNSTRPASQKAEERTPVASSATQEEEIPRVKFVLSAEEMVESTRAQAVAMQNSMRNKSKRLPLSLRRETARGPLFNCEYYIAMLFCFVEDTAGYADNKGWRKTSSDAHSSKRSHHTDPAIPVDARDRTATHGTMSTASGTGHSSITSQLQHHLQRLYSQSTARSRSAASSVSSANAGPRSYTSASGITSPLAIYQRHAADGITLQPLSTSVSSQSYAGTLDGRKRSASQSNTSHRMSELDARGSTASTDRKSHTSHRSVDDAEVDYTYHRSLSSSSKLSIV